LLRSLRRSGHARRRRRAPSAASPSTAPRRPAFDFSLPVATTLHPPLPCPPPELLLSPLPEPPSSSVEPLLVPPLVPPLLTPLLPVPLLLAPLLLVPLLLVPLLLLAPLLLLPLLAVPASR
jgi:hypothetical protein